MHHDPTLDGLQLADTRIPQLDPHEQIDIVHLHTDEGWRVDEIAEHYGLTSIVVRRILRNTRH